MMNRLRRAAGAQGHLQRGEDERRLEAAVQRPADHAPRVDVEDHGEIQSPVVGPDIRDIRRPLLIRSGRRHAGGQQRRRPRVGLRRPAESPPAAAV